MPIYEFECLDCGRRTEILMGSNETHLIACGQCGSKNVKKLLSAHAVINASKSPPQNPADRCCGAQGPPASCPGPGSCCGRT
ncbi:MAG: zinc ribbon domain-containing protein [Deltaproteobacteria bacterium]|nr:zinc ribbon domain-containing protein [Deltaproteobacteria bacterium]MBW1923860.1 zinc ribbon domain-containing protein [Deltaproteobacteria bacterium]MBW1949714.1 zinc ribbon domain-containing protein [Deltaproteobacteria bacterium]MBW2008353.1 zinc ribbon domain-containing protein [Deltaproteobacteria bacterium]MBW2102102.1 zinc ribbon domain-containing protein [Deltaproteobacteria bacterium]